MIPAIKALERLISNGAEVDAAGTVLREARRIGYAVSWQEWHVDVVGVGAAIKDATGAPIAAARALVTFSNASVSCDA